MLIIYHYTQVIERRFFSSTFHSMVSILEIVMKHIISCSVSLFSRHLLAAPILVVLAHRKDSDL